jgi:hypothetical protein
MEERKGGKYFYHNSIVLGWGTKYRIQLVLLHLGPCGSNLLEASSFRFTYQNALRFFLTALFRLENICFVLRESQIIRQGGAEGYGSLNPRLGNSE